MVELHDSSRFDDGTLHHKTVTVLQNVLDMQQEYAVQITTPASNMLMLKHDVILTSSEVQQYQNSGYTHIFVYEETATSGIKPEDYRILGVIELKVHTFFFLKKFGLQKKKRAEK